MRSINVDCVEGEDNLPIVPIPYPASNPVACGLLLRECSVWIHTQIDG
jgi:hypothetical protein